MSDADKIYVVDDDQSIRHSLTLLIEGVGRPAATFASGAAFFAGFDPSDAACIVLDVRLPDMDGISILQRLQKTDRPPPVLIITGHGDVPLAVKAMKAGATDFIEKPFNGETILEHIEAALAAPPTVAVVGDRRSDEATECLQHLTPREREVLEKLVIGQPNKIIAYELGISPRTVENHRARVMEKTQAKSLSHLVRMAMAAGINPDMS